MTEQRAWGLALSAIQDEAQHVNLIAASNYMSEYVQSASLPLLQSIHCEGYPRKRYHQGQDAADRIESYAVELAKKVFGADHANVQAYRGTPALLAAVMACADPGDSVLGMECSSGGHYVSGSPVHLLARLYTLSTYTVARDDQRISYDEVHRRALQTRPKVIVCGDTSYPRQWDFQRMAEIAADVGAYLIADASQTFGLIAGGVATDPVPHADVVMGATYKTMRGPRAALLLCRDELADRLDRAVYPTLQGGTNVMQVAAVAASLEETLTTEFATYCARVIDNASVLAATVADGGFDLVTGGTDNHAFLVDLSSSGLGGREAAVELGTHGLVCNANQVPFDPRPPASPSGIRFGTPACTTLGMGADDMRWIGERIVEILDRRIRAKGPSPHLAAEIREFRERHPAPAAIRTLTAATTGEGTRQWNGPSSPV